MSTILPEHTIPLLRMALRMETDVVYCRNRARQLAEAMGFDRQQQVRIATAVSEIARNAFRYARNAQADFALIAIPAKSLASPPRQGLLTTLTDEGAGITELEAVLNGTYRSQTGMGAGIRGAKRLLDQMEIQTGAQGTTVDLVQFLPVHSTVKREHLQKVVAEMAQAAAANPMEELAVQNQELVETLDQISTQRGELEQINEELSETNRGVVALYDELETVHRVGRVVASKLDFDSLLSAITDATTELSGAEFGAYFQVSQENQEATVQTVSGTLGEALRHRLTVPVAGILPPGEGDVLRLDDCLAQGHQGPLGTELPLRSFLSCPVRDNSGNLIGLLVFGHRKPGVFTERTDRILSTVAVQASIGIANAKLYRNAQSANAAKDRFLAILSHELRTPLNPVFALLTALEEHPRLPYDVRDDLAVMRRNLELETRLIDDLLDLTRIAQNKMPLQAVQTDFHALVEAVCHTCQGEIRRKKTRIKLDLQAERFWVSGDSGRLQQVLWNLLNNAVKFTPERGEIIMQTHNPAPDRLCFSIKDNGRGIEPAALHRVFNPFEQADDDVAARFGGLGLGLAISKSIIDAHNGEIRVESGGLDQGTTFYVDLPTVNLETDKPLPAGILGTPQAIQTAHILLVDDHDDTRMIMGRMLTLRGHKVVEASSVQDAIAKFRAGQFDLIVSDLGLPDGSGHDLMALIQSERPTKGIVLSGYGMEADIAKSKKVGFSEHLTKPVDFAELDHAIARIQAED